MSLVLEIMIISYSILLFLISLVYIILRWHFKWYVDIDVSVLRLFFVFVIMCIVSAILMLIPISDTNDIELDTKEIYTFDGKPSITKNIEKGYDIHKRIPYQVTTYSYYYIDSNKRFGFSEINPEKAEIYCIDYNETQRVETYTCNEGRITAFSFPERTVLKTYDYYKIYLHEDQIPLLKQI